MDEPCVCDPSQTFPGVIVVVADRLVTQVAARHDERKWRTGRRAGNGSEQQGGERRERQKTPAERIARSNGRREWTRQKSAQQHHWSLRSRQDALLFCTDLGDTSRTGEVSHHDGEGFVRTILPTSQFVDRRIAQGVTGQVVAPDPFYRGDLAPGESELRPVDGSIRITFVVLTAASWSTALEPELPPTSGPRNRLCVVTTIVGILVFAPAVAAHRESGHRRIRSIVRKLSRDREPGTAVGAIYEEIATAQISW